MKVPIWELLYKYFSVIAFAAFKVLGGAVTGYVLGLSYTETVILSAAGMMLTVVVLTFFGERLRGFILRRFFKKRKLFTPLNRKKVRVWRKFGLLGAALLTPPLFTPPGGALLAVSFGENRKKIFFYMLIGAVLWALIFSLIVFSLGLQAKKLLF